MTSQEKKDKLATYVLYHLAEGMGPREAIEHVATGIGIPADAVRLAVRDFITT